MDYGGRGAKGQFKQADRHGARWAVVIGADELHDNVCNLRDMESGEERKISVSAGSKELLRAIQ
jgi:histidyl-tRNA synthetase